MPSGPMAVTWVMYSPDFAQWKWAVLPGRTMTLPGGYARHFIAVELVAPADIENAGHDCVDPVLWVPMWHQLHVGRDFDPDHVGTGL